MTSFLYYLPGHAKEMISPEEIAKAGIGYVFEKNGGATVNALHASGPDGGMGAIITDPLRIEPGRNQFKPAEQTWLKNEAAGYWVGMWNEDKPGPEELIRTKPLSGEWLELADERQWFVPIARRWSESDDPKRYLDSNCNLPRPLTFGVDKAYMGKPFKRYAALWCICEADLRLNTKSETESDRAIFCGAGAFAAIAILQANYAIGASEVEMLEMFSQDTPREILNVFNDWATYNAIVEKKTRTQSDSPPSSSGPEDAPPSIDQP